MTPLEGGCLAFVGLVFVLGWSVLRSRSVPAVLLALFPAVGVTAVVAGILSVPAPDVAVRVGLVSVFALLLPLLVLYPDGRGAPGVGHAGTAVVAGLGWFVVTAPSADRIGLYALAQVVLVIALLSWRFERSTDRERRSLLWLVLTLGGGGLLAGHVAFLSPDPRLAAVLTAAALLPAPVGLVVGLAAPEVVDVRAVMTRVVVEATTLVAAVALFVTLSNLLALGTGAAPDTGPLAVVAALSAVGYAPLRGVLLGTVDRLLFGEREGPAAAASHVGRTLEDPVLALRALREALVVPYAALHTDGRLVASSGAPAFRVHERDLTLGQRTIGRLEVGLRPGDLRLPARDLVVLDVVAPALAQTLHALALTRQLHSSRADVIRAVEEERRRLRHDLHDTVGPTLTGIAYTADAARNSVSDDPAGTGRLLERLREDTAAAIDDVRRVVEGLRPPAVDELGLVGALRQRLVSLHGADGRPVTVRLQADEPMAALPAAVEVAAYRIVVEATTNALRHTRCDAVSVRLCREGHRLTVEVRDDGDGSGSWRPGVGLTSMRDRAEQLGGVFTVTAGTGGAVVRAEFPLA